MSSAEFKERGHEVIDFIARYWQDIQTRPVQSQVDPGEILKLLPASPPAFPDFPDDLGAELERTIMPGITHWQSPNFFGYFPANASAPSVLGELLSAGLGVQGMLWLTSPACTELETRVMDWLAQMLALPPQFHSTSTGGGVIQSTASDAALVALVAARHRSRTVLKKLNTSPLPAFTLYTSSQAHSSIIKSAMVAGLADGPLDNTHLRLIDVDRAGRMRVDLLQQAIIQDLTKGKLPFFVAASVGTTGTTAIDPVPEIARVLRSTAAQASLPAALVPWLHIDAAHAGAAAICPEFRSLLAGAEHCDSLCFNAHKWLLTNFDCDCFFVRDRRTLTDALSITPEYLRNRPSDSGEVFDYRDWQIPLGRRFRALKLWLVIRHYGVNGLQTHIREHIRLSALFESFVAADDRFELVAPRTLNLICFRLKDSAKGDLNKILLDSLNSGGKLFLTHTSLPPSMGGHKCILRLAIGATFTAESHVRAAWNEIQTHATKLLA